ncbi:hypothetical protein ACFQZT_25380 [Paenibacillus sp. GCM10027628]|uniref:RNA polymerase factor sigma-54 n=1 Tax=Paenibacillus sp. GCM10027628 TaxID=3273413 RepID=UPI00363138C4
MELQLWVRGHLQDLAKGIADKISKELDIDTHQVSKILDCIRMIDSRPGLTLLRRSYFVPTCGGKADDTSILRRRDAYSSISDGLLRKNLN